MSLTFERVPDLPHAFAAVLPDRAATAALASALSGWIEAGDVIALAGDVGAGKTEFARDLIRAYGSAPELDVPSPTFPLLLTYDLPRGRVAHFDLYRIIDEDELEEIGFEEAGEGAVVLLEWPERAGGKLPADRIMLDWSLAPDLGPQARRLILRGFGKLAQKVERFVTAERLIQSSGFGEAERVHLQGDASTRAYTRLVGRERSAILMNAPRRADGPPVRFGLPYSRLVHLAEDVKPFVAMDRALKAEGLSAPAIHAADLDAGLLVLEDFGGAFVVAGDPPTPVKARYEAAIEVLASLHARALPKVLSIAPRVEYELPVYDTQALLIELELMLDWYLPLRGAAIDGVVREEFLLLWRNALAPVQAEEKTWVLRDYHSPNLLWLEEREGLKKVGLIDFQDAVLGPAAYDVASLAQDARVDVPEHLEIHLLGLYVRARREADPTFDARSFARSYAVMGAQRATKILGIFARLDRRDGKPQYLRHLPRVRRYLARCLGHQELGALRAWYEATLPPKDLIA